MKTFSYTITDEVGIHARPAGLLAKKAKEFESVCTIEKGGKSVNITKLMALMGLGVSFCVFCTLGLRFFFYFIRSFLSADNAVRVVAVW